MSFLPFPAMAHAMQQGGGSAWTPADLAPLEWWDFSDAGTVTLVSGAVSVITSKGSGARSATQGTAINQPTLVAAAQNGRDVANFDGTNDRLALSSTISTTATMTVAQVFRRASAGIKSLPLGGSSGGVPPYSPYWATDNIRYSALWSSASSFATHGSANTSTGVFQHIAVKGASTTALYQDGTIVGTAQPTLSGSGPLATMGLRAADYHNGWIAEILVIASDLSSPDREKLEGYLAHKWGLAASLPALHPYKVSPP